MNLLSVRISRLLIACAYVGCSAQAVLGHEALIASDAHTSAIYPDRNFGDSPLLTVGAKERTFLKFDLSALPANLPPSQIAKATLQLWVSQTTSSGSVKVFEVTEAWDETTITQRNTPSVADSESGSFTVTAKHKRIYATADLTTAVRAWIAGERINNGIALVAFGAGAAAKFDSKENSATSHEPHLEIVLAGPFGPKGDQGLTGKDGKDGKDGTNGLTGRDGNNGLNGEKGEKGDKGDPGPATPLPAGTMVAAPNVSGATFPQGYSDTGLRTADWTVRLSPNYPPAGYYELYPAGTRLFVGGSGAFAEYDLINDEYRSAPILVPGPSGAAVTGCADTFVYAFGGMTNPGQFSQAPSTSSRRYNTSTAIWEALPDMPQAISGGTAIAVGSRLYVFGGYAGNLEYDTVTRSWREIMPTPGRVNLARNQIIAMGDAIYAMNPGKLLRYFPSTNQWTEEADSMTNLAQSLLAPIDSSSFILLAQGSGSSTGLAFRYSTDTTNWSTEAPPPVPIQMNASAANLNGELVIITYNGQQVIRVKADSFKRLLLRN